MSQLFLTDTYLKASTVLRPPPLLPPYPRPHKIQGDGYCDAYGEDTNNVESCAYDGGDCCICTCVSANYDCPDTDSGYRCEDPTAECFEEPGPTPGPVAEQEETDITADDSSAPRFGTKTLASAAAATAAGAFGVTALCGGFATAVGW